MRRFLQQQVNRFDFQVIAFHLRHWRIKDDLAVVNDDGATADLLDITRVMRREKNSDTFLGVQCPIRSRIRCLAMTSSPMVGSSRNMTDGLCSSAAASSQRIRSPRLSLRSRRAHVILDIKDLYQKSRAVCDTRSYRVRRCGPAN